MTGSDLCDTCSLYCFVRYLWDFVISNQLSCDARSKVCLMTLKTVSSLLALGNILHVHKYRLRCLKLQVQSDDFLLRPFKCWVSVCHLLLGQWCWFVIMHPIVYQQMTSVPEVHIQLNKRMSSLPYDMPTWTLSVVKVHLFLSLLSLLYLSIFLTCSSSEMANSGFLFVCVIERRKDKKWEILWMKGCDIVDTDRSAFAWHVIHLDYLKKWAMNSILWFTCEMTHSWFGLCV